MGHSDPLVLLGTTIQQRGLGENTGGAKSVTLGWFLSWFQLGKCWVSPYTHPPHYAMTLHPLSNKEGPGTSRGLGWLHRKPQAGLCWGRLNVTPLVGCEDGVSRLSLVPRMWAGVLILMVTFVPHCCS